MLKSVNGFKNKIEWREFRERAIPDFGDVDPF
jgi:hypothetical protein